MKRILKVTMTAMMALAIASAAPALESSAGQLKVEPVVTGLDAPWSVGFLPGRDMLITERDGKLLYVSQGTLHEVEGLPDIAVVGQGGLLDVLVPRDFAETREIFLSFAKPQRRDAGTALARARLSEDNKSLSDVEVIFEIAQGSSGGQHFGSRIVEGKDATLFLTIGDRGDRPSAQDLSRENGSVVRVGRDGRIPADNPFVGQENLSDAIWSYGHRNPQGATLDLDGRLIVVEHGARGGDEVNIVEKGLNYGWPVIAYGRHYTGGRIGEGSAKEGMEQPAAYWDPSIAPSGAMVYSGKLWPEWKGDLFVGSLKFDYISRLEGDPLKEVEQISSDETLRVRDIREGPDGAIWFLSVGNGTLYKVTPE